MRNPTAPLMAARAIFLLGLVALGLAIILLIAHRPDFAISGETTWDRFVEAALFWGPAALAIATLMTVGIMLSDFSARVWLAGVGGTVASAALAAAYMRLAVDTYEGVAGVAVVVVAAPVMAASLRAFVRLSLVWLVCMLLTVASTVALYVAAFNGPRDTPPSVIGWFMAVTMLGLMALAMALMLPFADGAAHVWRSARGRKASDSHSAP